jgi:hypothetical protein
MLLTKIIVMLLRAMCLLVCESTVRDAVIVKHFVNGSVGN